MRGMREHVHHAGFGQSESMAIDENTRIARQRSGMTRNIHDSIRALARQIVEYGGGTRARRVEQQFAVFAACPCGTGMVEQEIGGVKPRIVDAVSLGIRRRAGNQALIAFDADHRQ